MFLKKKKKKTLRSWRKAQNDQNEKTSPKPGISSRFWSKLKATCDMARLSIFRVAHSIGGIDNFGRSALSHGVPNHVRLHPKELKQRVVKARKLSGVFFCGCWSEGKVWLSRANIAKCWRKTTVWGPKVLSTQFYCNFQQDGPACCQTPAFLLASRRKMSNSTSQLSFSAALQEFVWPPRRWVGVMENRTVCRNCAWLFCFLHIDERSYLFNSLSSSGLVLSSNGSSFKGLPFCHSRLSPTCTTSVTFQPQKTRRGMLFCVFALWCSFLLMSVLVYTYEFMLNKKKKTKLKT